MKLEGRGQEYGVKHFQVVQTMSLVSFIEQSTGLERSRIDELIWLGAGYVNDKRVSDPALPVATGDRVRLHSTPRRFGCPTNLRDRIIHSDPDILIVDKPSGIPVHALTDNVRENLLSFLMAEVSERLFITHRLDVETSGLLVIAKNHETQTRINSLIANRKVKRLYQAWVHHPVALGSHVHFMSPSPKAPKHMVSEALDGFLRCELKIHGCRESSEREVREVHGDLPLNGKPVYRLDIELLTGRSQQIRAQLASLGSPIIGDRIYGGSIIEVADDIVFRTIGLRAVSLEIDGQKYEANYRWKLFERETS